MSKKRKLLLIISLLLVLLLATAVAAAPAPLTVWLKANQSVIVRCVDQTGEIIIEPASDTEVEVTCRVWIRE